jgi:hypothetical protein
MTCLAVIAGFPAAIPARQPLQSDARLMSDAEYREVLAQIEALLPKWETLFKSIDPEKFPQIPYFQGKLLADKRDLGLKELGNIRVAIAEAQRKRTIRGELALQGGLEILSNLGGQILDVEDAVGASNFTNLPNFADLLKYAPESDKLSIRILNDALARVEMLENGACPSRRWSTIDGRGRFTEAGLLRAPFPIWFPRAAREVTAAQKLWSSPSFSLRSLQTALGWREWFWTGWFADYIAWRHSQGDAGGMTGLSNGFSKKWENLEGAYSLWFAYYNFCRVHTTLRVTPAWKAGIADHPWSVNELLLGW